MSDDIAVGIDLGTSYSCVAVVQDGQPLVIPNEWGESTHASCVSFLDDGTVLVGNAAKYTHPRGRIRIRVAREDSFAAVCILDTGIGIPVGELGRVFDLFSQVREHQSHSEGGLGIGLSLVRSLTELHGGSVQVRSQGPGLGSEFIVRLPLDESGQGRLSA